MLNAYFLSLKVYIPVKQARHLKNVEAQVFVPTFKVQYKGTSKYNMSLSDGCKTYETGSWFQVFYSLCLRMFPK